MTTAPEKSTINSANFLATLEQRNNYIGVVRAYENLVKSYMDKKLYDYHLSYVSQLPSKPFVLKATYMLHLLHKFDMDVGQCTPSYLLSSNYFRKYDALLNNLDHDPGLALYSCKLGNNNQRTEFSLATERAFGQIESTHLLKTINDPEAFSRNYNSENFNKVNLKDYLGFAMNPNDVKFGSESPKALVEYILQNVRGGVPAYHQPHEFHTAYENILSLGDKNWATFNVQIKEQIASCFKKYFDTSNTEQNKLKCFNPTIDASEPAEVIHSKIRTAADEFVAQAKTHCYNKAVDAIGTLNDYFLSVLQQGSKTDVKLMQLQKTAKSKLDICAFVFPFKTSADDAINQALTTAVNSGYLAPKEDTLHCEASEYSQLISEHIQ